MDFDNRYSEMRSNQRSHNIFIRTLWLCWALCIMLLCGPIKRVVEYKVNGPVSKEITDKHLKTGIREKRDTHLFQIVYSSHNDCDFSPALLTAVLLTLAALFPPKRTLSVSILPVPGRDDLPLYLHLRRIQV